MMPTLFGALCALALLLFLVLTSLLAKKSIPADRLLPRFLLVPPLVFLCSRFVFIAGNCTYYITTLSNPALALRFWDGGYSLMGAFLGILLSALLFDRDRRHYLDAAVTACFPAIALERIAESGTMLGQGKPLSPALASGFLGQLADGFLPVWLPEAVVALVLFFIGLSLRKRKLPAGHIWVRLLILFGATQTLFESLRDDGHLVVHFVRIQQVLAFLMLLVPFWTCFFRSRKRNWLLFTAVPVLAGLGIFCEFGVDRWGNRALAYGLMVLILILLTAASLYQVRLYEKEASPLET